MNGRQRILAAGLFVVAWGTNVSTPLILLYQDRLDLSDLGAVGIFTVYVIGILGALLFAGRLSDRFGRRPLVLPFTALSGIASIVLILGRDSLLVLFIGRLLLGAVSGAVLSLGASWLTELGIAEPTPADRLRLGNANAFAIYIGFGVGPLTSAVYELVGPAPLVVPFLFHAAATAGILVAMWALPETKPPDPTVSLKPQLGVPPAARPEFLGTLAPAAIWVFGFPSTSFALFPVILRDVIGSDLDVIVAGVTGTLTAFSSLISRPILRRADDPRAAIRTAMWIGVAGYVLGTTAFATGVWQLAPLAAIAMGAASGTILSAGLAITESIASTSNRGALNATFYFAAYCGMAMPVIITLGARVASLNVALTAVTLVSAATAVYLTVVRSPITRPA